MKTEVISLNTGLPESLPYRGREVSTGIRKHPVREPAALLREGLAGDGQADLVHHGGPDKAVCVYPWEHYAFWAKELEQQLGFGAFGENLTLHGLQEASVCIGDMFRLGTALVQVSQPRQPCFKLSVRYGRPDLPLLMQETGFTGWYFRVLEEGRVHAPCPLELTERPSPGWTVSEANRIMHRDTDDMTGTAELLAVPALSASWRATLQRRLEGIPTDPAARLHGSQGLR
ncbi:MOSC domain-containing protein [Paenibacillus mucilaginosus]|uniref:YflK2 n=2 Tax=Paenibacillus mucilaginosus TaxID=61624 RepID=H6NBD7_9BACL|nr:MOSC domain-containing protein [Paenibacillus mucilaginosus]AEI45138.1 YflK2 [Paenibacillus mucilaginosus KNP414]AFC32883.1 YflK2 [Paenibacillus mucilaginosus 3016]MCG7212969.1 MOSC domain-containing protein [Paenibacillus mucilaginosus]WDM26619.1 MOSC domain-containing protein [Paenibacillus mucilaginosus]WFA21333.1 MOSC domain-containing protein [Paenibacillus mucilaginosus]